MSRIYKNNRKGSILIFAVIMSVVLFVSLSGMYVRVNQNTKITTSDYSRNDLFFAAQSGANYNLEWLKNIEFDIPVLTDSISKT